MTIPVAPTAQNHQIEKQQNAAARLSLCSNAVLLLLKLGVAWLSGSVSVLSEAAHSASDLLASIIAVFALRLVGLPPDEAHPYGHGKAEGLSTLVQGTLLGGVGTYITYEAVHKLLAHDKPERVELGMAVMLLSAITNMVVVRVVARAARETGSLSLAALSKDHFADIYAAGGVLIGLLLVRVTGFGAFDSLLALAVAGLIFRSCWQLLRDAVELLMDAQLPLEELDKVRGILDAEPEVQSYHKLRTRKSGAVRYVDAHILLDDSMTLLHAHDLTEAVEDRIRAALPHTEVTLHTEPYNAEQQHQKQAHHASSDPSEES